MRNKTFLLVIPAVILWVASFVLARWVVAVAPNLVGVMVRVYPYSSPVQYVSSSDYFYVKHGHVQPDWSTFPVEAQNLFLDIQQTYFTLHTSAPNFQDPPLTHYTDYDNETDSMFSMFFFQFRPGDLAPGTYMFTGTWVAPAYQNYTAVHFQNTITLVIVAPVPIGENVTVDPSSDLRLTFSNVTADGYASARTTNETSTVEAPPLANPVGQVYDVNVTAGYSGNVTVSLAYVSSNLTQQQENNLRMVQYTPIAGDVVAYGKVDILDIATVAKSFGATPDSSRWNEYADIDGNGNVNILDISLCAKNFGQTAEWTDITTYVDTELDIVHGDTTHFSFIGIH